MKKSKLFALVLAVVLTLSSLVPSFANTEPRPPRDDIYENLPGDRNYFFTDIKVGKPMPYESSFLELYLETYGADYLVFRDSKNAAINRTNGSRIIVYPGISDGYKVYEASVYGKYPAGEKFEVYLTKISSNFTTKANPKGVVVATGAIFVAEESGKGKAAPKDTNKVHEPIYTHAESKNSKSPTGYIVGSNKFKITDSMTWGLNPKKLKTSNMPSMMFTKEYVHHYEWLSHFKQSFIPNGKPVKGDAQYDYPSPLHNSGYPYVTDHVWYSAANVANPMQDVDNYEETYFAQGRLIHMAPGKDENGISDGSLNILIQIPEYLTWGFDSPGWIGLEKGSERSYVLLNVDEEYVKYFPVDLKFGQEVVFNAKAVRKHGFHPRTIKTKDGNASVLLLKSTALYDAWFYYDTIRYMNEIGL